MSEEVPFALVVVAYRDPEALDRMIRPLRGVTETVDVVVVNVTSDPLVAAVARSLDAREVSTIENVGFAAAVNLGVAAISADMVVVANDDLEVSFEALETLAATAGGVGVAVPMLVNPSGEQIPSIRPLATPFTLLREWALLPDAPVRGLRWLQVEKWRRPSVPVVIDAATAAIVAVQTSLIRRHPFPNEYFMYWEEMEWFWTLRQAGVQTWFVPHVTAIRRDGPTTLSPQKARLMARNAVRVVRRTQGSRAAVLAWVVVVAWSLRLALAELVRFSTGRSGREPIRSRAAGVRSALAALAEVR